LRELERLVKPSGFYRVKARRIQEISRQIVRDFGGTVPRKREDLLSLSGVGPKTAGCVQVYAFGDDALPVDTHVHRISNRLGLVKTKAPEKTEPELKKAIPRKYWREINLLMVSFGQKVCLPRNPRCGICGLKKICRYYTFYPKEHSYDADNAHGNGQPARCLWKNYTASCALSQNQQLKVALHETSKNCLANEAVISKVCSCCTRLHQNVS
jgi:adenine-specific DNA glycosylase